MIHKTGSLDMPPGFKSLFLQILLNKWIPIEVNFLMTQGRVNIP